MPNLLAGLGTFSYAGVDLSGPRVSSEVNGEIVEDDARRSVKYVKWVFDIKTFVEATAATTDNQMDVLRNTLTRPGGTFIYASKGFGTMVVNRGNVWDVNWGPKPKILRWVPIGSRATAFVHFRLEVCIPQCPGAVWYRNALVMHNFSLNFDLDAEGLTTVTIAGKIEIPLTRYAGLPVTLDQVDNYRALTVPTPVKGFRRESSSYQVSEDRKTLTFRHIDKQFPSFAYPDKVTVCDFKHSYQSSRRTRVPSVIWEGRLAGKLAVAPDTPKRDVWNKWLQIVGSRLETLKEGIGVEFFGIQPIKPWNLLITGLFFEEDVFGRTTTFSLNYEVLGVSLGLLLEAGGLWQPIRDTSYARWQRSLRNTVYDPQGRSIAKADVARETLIDLCNQPTAGNPMQNSWVPHPPGDMVFEWVPEDRQEGPELLPMPEIVDPDQDLQDFVRDNPGNVIGGVQGVAGAVDPEKSWLAYNAGFRWDENDHIVRHKPLAGTVTKKAGVDHLGGVDRVAKNTNITHNVTATVPDIAQRISSPSCVITLVGSAMRVGYEIEPPQLIKFGGQPATQMERHFQNVQIDSSGDVPIYACSWRIPYLVPLPPEKVSHTANPFYRFGGRT